MNEAKLNKARMHVMDFITVLLDEKFEGPYIAAGLIEGLAMLSCASQTDLISHRQDAAAKAVVLLQERIEILWAQSCHKIKGARG